MPMTILFSFFTWSSLVFNLAFPLVSASRTKNSSGIFFIRPMQSAIYLDFSIDFLYFSIKVKDKVFERVLYIIRKTFKKNLKEISLETNNEKEQK